MTKVRTEVHTGVRHDGSAGGQHEGSAAVQDVGSAGGQDEGVLAGSVLEVIRDTADDVQDRWVRVFVNDLPEEILRYGETLRLRVAPGRHRVKAHNTLSSHVIEVDVAAGQTVRIRCHNRVGKGSTLMMLTIGFAFINVRLEVVGS